jgi:hypothetical protein
MSVTAAAAIGTTAAMAYYCLKSRSLPIRTVVPVEEQSLQVGVRSGCPLISRLDV